MYTQIASNKRRSILLIIVFLAIVAGLDYVISRAFSWSQATFYLVLVAGAVYALISYFFSAQMAVSMSGARPVQKKDAPELYRVVENLTIAAGLPMPKVYIINDPSPNAFATGRDPGHAIVAVTAGLLAMMDKDELEGVIAHELSHVGNYDIRFMALVVALVSIVAIISDLFLRISFWTGDEREQGGGQLFFILGIIGAILAPIVAALIQFAVSRQREYLADASGALLTRYPDGLASALAKIGHYDQPMKHANSATSSLYISNPLKGRSLAGLFDTHPPIADRIKRLREMETKQ